MPISGLRITLSRNQEHAQRAIDALRCEPAVEVGVRSDQHLAIVLDTPDETTNRAVWQRLHSLRGIEHVDVTFASIDPEPKKTANSLEEN